VKVPLVFALLWFTLATGCTSPAGDTIRVDVFVATDRVLQDVYVIAGTDKKWWPELAASERGTFQLRLAHPAELTVNFRTGARRFTWTQAAVDANKIRVVQLDLSDKTDPPVAAKLIPR
jgi:hypothetical protein